MRVVFSREAQQDLERIKTYIGYDSPRRAVTFVAELVNAALQISETPKGFNLVPRYEQRGVRRKPYGAYLIFYRIQADGIGIVHILHSAQDYETLLFPEDKAGGPE